MYSLLVKLSEKIAIFNVVGRFLNVDDNADLMKAGNFCD